VAAIIHKESRIVDRRLKQYFASDRYQWIEVVKAAVAARAGCTAHYPKASPGFYAWSGGMARMRQMFCREGYESSTQDGVETILNRELKVKIGFVSTDIGTCNENASPRNRTIKGPTAERLTDLNNQLDLFKREGGEEMPTGIPLWQLCVFDNGTIVRAEISRPIVFLGGYWLEFAERIFLISGDEWSKIATATPPASQLDDYEVTIKRR
jgi:hypothetical protein